MLIPPSEKIICGTHSPHECIEAGYKCEKIRGSLVDINGNVVEYTLRQCNKCGALFMRGDKANTLKYRYKDYEFIHIPKKKKNHSSKPLTQEQIRNAEYLTKSAIAEAQGLSKKKESGNTPDYVLKGEAPTYMQWNASHPFRGGSPK